MKRLKQNGLTPIKVKETRSILKTAGSPEKKNQITATAVLKMNEKAQQAKNKNKSKGLQQDLDLSFIKIGTGIKNEDLMAFTQSFHLLKKAGFTNVRALTTLLENTKNPNLRDIIADILNGIEAGEYIYTTLEHYPKVFPPLYINIVKVGELSDSLAESLMQALSSLEDAKDMKRKMKKAVMSPMIMIVALIAMSFIGVIWGLPVMQNLYAELGVEDQIPEATLAFAEFVNKLGEYWYLVGAVIGGIVFAFMTWIRTPSGRFQFDKFKYKMPIFGQLLIRLDLQKFLRAMQLNLENNSKLDDSIEVSKSVIKNYMFLAIIEGAQNNLSQGLSWVEPFENCTFMPSMVIEMLKIGMETDIKNMMSKITDYVSDDIEITMARITAAVPQVAMGISGVVLVFFMIVILKPIMEVYMGNFLFDAYGM